jgi:hypothetical protein
MQVSNRDTPQSLEFWEDCRRSGSDWLCKALHPPAELAGVMDDLPEPHLGWRKLIKIQALRAPGGSFPVRLPACEVGQPAGQLRLGQNSRGAVTTGTLQGRSGREARLTDL